MPLVIRSLGKMGSKGGVAGLYGYGLYGLGSKSEHWAQIGSALFCKTIVLVSTKLLSVRIAGVSGRYS